ncbi:hypothetical protein HDK64DRAFT_265019 [Phyllosticta capitalensis]
MARSPQVKGLESWMLWMMIVFTWAVKGVRFISSNQEWEMTLPLSGSVFLRRIPRVVCQLHSSLLLSWSLFAFSVT